jgi:hypothetical protein
VTAGRLLALEWVEPHGPWDDQLVFVFDSGTLTSDQVTALQPIDPELDELTFATPAEARDLLRQDVAALLQRAHAANSDETTHYAERSG